MDFAARRQRLRKYDYHSFWTQPNSTTTAVAKMDNHAVTTATTKPRWVQPQPRRWRMMSEDDRTDQNNAGTRWHLWKRRWHCQKRNLRPTDFFLFFLGGGAASGTPFFVATKWLYKRVCPSVDPSVCQSILPSVSLSVRRTAFTFWTPRMQLMAVYLATWFYAHECCCSCCCYY